MVERKSHLREQFEHERRRSAFLTALFAGGAGIIATDTWLATWAGALGGLALGFGAYGLVWVYESYMWRREHGR